ncbi:MJ0042 family finger-like domain-containing protein [Paracoccus alkenifer]|uniref:MJ0042 family finger-like domain-containing protein n=2 Tax=Paracoccus alkenifer TaxID=65735 RepID=A0A1H6JSF9_9RHOB|nr:MJ0042 family finger-like domain-containing protein [Paracoccus alkenifer]
MRLICPRCGAQYEIDASAIPAAGRDVECSACDHIWRARPEGDGFDPAARPRLSRPLSESVIEILRQEAARELEVRAAERRSQRLGEAALADPPIAEAAEPAPGAPASDPAAPSPDDTLLPGDAPEPGFQTGAAAVPATKVMPSAASTAPPAAPPAGSSLPAPAPLSAAAPPAVLPPALRDQTARRRHDAGFHVAVVLSLSALALYALAPRLADQQPYGPTLVEWRGKVDHLRDRLAAHGDAAIAQLRAVVDGQRAAGD